MYYPIGWPKVLKLINTSNSSIQYLDCNSEKSLFAILTDDSLLIYSCKPCLLLFMHKRQQQSLNEYGINKKVKWRPDSSSLVVVTANGFLLLYKVTNITNKEGPYKQIDPPQYSLRRDSAELYIKQMIPSLEVFLEKAVFVNDKITCLTNIKDELMIATNQRLILRYKWDLTIIIEYCIKLENIQFCFDQSTSNSCIQLNTYIIDMVYSPLIGGFSVVLNDGRSAFFTSDSVKFNPNQMQGIWASNIYDGTCMCVNHKFKLITFGRRNSHCYVYKLDETNRSLALVHELIIPQDIHPGTIGSVCCMQWSPDACVLAVAWETGGVSLWSTFGTLLMCSLLWDYGVNVDISLSNPFTIHAMEWSAEGYQLWMATHHPAHYNYNSVMQLAFVKSSLTVNPCVCHQNHMFLQGEDKLYINFDTGLTKTFDRSSTFGRLPGAVFTSPFLNSKQWRVIQIPSIYCTSNWPIRYTSMNYDGNKLCVAGQTGLAHYSLLTNKWSLFGNETQEKDMSVSGGLHWWKDFIVAGCYNIPRQKHELRLYPSNLRLSNTHMTCLKLSSQALIISSLKNKILVFCADGLITMFNISGRQKESTNDKIELFFAQTIDTSSLCASPVCFVSLTVTSKFSQAANFVINISGKLILAHQRDDSQLLESPLVLASCVENVWFSDKSCKYKSYLNDALWLYCGVRGMFIWLPLIPLHKGKDHKFMAKHIMLCFKPTIYPLAIQFDDALLVGADNETLLYSSEPHSPFSLPFCILEKSCQIFLHHILRQLICQNLGFRAWEIACYYTPLTHFSHILELLLHEVLEAEATCKIPLPDAQLPCVIEFIKEFPGYLETLVKCARKSEMSLWPYLFSVAGKPIDLFNKCLNENHLDTAASYLLILQNLESFSVSSQCARMLLKKTLNCSNWKLSKYLVRFLKTIDADNVNYLVAQISLATLQRTQSNEVENLPLLMGIKQAIHTQHFSTGSTSRMDYSSKSKEMQVIHSKVSNTTATYAGPEKINSNVHLTEFILDLMIESHAKKLLTEHRLHDLGCMAVHLDFPLVQWFAKERNQSAIVENCITAIKDLHSDFSWPYPTVPSSILLSSERSYSTNFSGPPSKVVDSGYMSYQSSNTLFPEVDQQSLFSEAGSCISSYDGELKILPQLNSPSIDLCLDQISDQGSTARGPIKSETQLRYLFQLLIDAGCLQWALLISVLLRDGMAVCRVVNAARSKEQTYEAVERLKQDLATLFQWSSEDCFGYKLFMSIIQGQIIVLNSIVANKQKNTTSMPHSEVSNKLFSIDNSSTFNDEIQYMKNELHNNSIHDSISSSVSLQLKKQYNCSVM